MNLTDKKSWPAALSFCLVLLMAGQALSQNNSAFERLTDRFKEGKIFRAGFSHIYIDSYTQDTLKSNGKIWIGEDRYKVRAQKQTVVVDGKTSMVYDERRNRVIISKYEPAEDDFAPSRILNGIDSTFTVEAEEQRKDEIYILLTSHDPFAIYQKVEIFLSPALIPRKIEALDPADNLVITTFDEGKFISIEQGMFRLDYPQGAEIVDMRN